MHETKHGGQWKSRKTICISILSQQVHQTNQSVLLAGKDFIFVALKLLLHIVICSGRVDGRHNIFKQPWAGIFKVNLYLPGKALTNTNRYLYCHQKSLSVFSHVLVKLNVFGTDCREYRYIILQDLFEKVDLAVLILKYVDILA